MVQGFEKDYIPLFPTNPQKVDEFKTNPIN